LLKFTQKWPDRFSVSGGSLMYRGCLVVPQSLCKKVLAAFHDNNGHFDSRRTLARMSARYWWYGMSSAINKYVRGCLPCATGKSHGRIPATMGSLPTPGPFELVFVDIVGPLPRCRGYSYILTMEDSFTKWIEAVPLSAISANAVAMAFVRTWIYRFGPPVTIHSDQGSQFESGLFKRLCTIFGMKKTRTTAYHPQGNGAIERFHRTLKERLLTSKSTKDWVHCLPPSLFAYRTMPHASTNMTPFQLTYGFTPQIPEDWPTTFSNNKDGYVNDLRRYWNRVQEGLGEPGVAKLPLHVGDSVLVRVPQTSKLQKPWVGPRKIVAIKGPTTMEIENEGVVHVNRLKFFAAAQGVE
jgi:transposase InsO family protein